MLSCWTGSSPKRRGRRAHEAHEPASELIHRLDTFLDLARRTPVSQALALFASEDRGTSVPTPSGRVLETTPHQERHRLPKGSRPALGAHLRAHPSPWVIIGAEPAVAQFRRMTQNTTRLAGVVTGNHLNAPLSDVADLTGPVITSYLRSRQDEALALLEQRTGQDRALYGIDTAWLAARWERPEMLIVEEGFFYPARVSADGDGLVPAADADHPDVLDDAVDELIETVLLRGGWVALAADGAIPQQARIALTTQR